METSLGKSPAAGRSHLGELLVAEGLLSQDAVNRALVFQRSWGGRLKLGTLLIDRDLVGEGALLATLAKLHRCTAVDWQTLSAANLDALRLLPPAHALRLSAVPYALEKSSLRVAFGNPADLNAVDQVAAITGKRVVPGVTTQVRLIQAQQKYYGRRVPSEFRAIILKLQSRGSEIGRGPAPTPAVFSRQANPISVPGRASPPPPPRRDEDPIRSGDDSLAQWFREALTAFQKVRGAPEPPRPEVTTPRSRPVVSGRTATSGTVAGPRPDPVEDAISGMWRASSLEDADDVAASMWRSNEDPQVALRLWEARSREEIGQVVLSNALTNLPRVILFGSGKVAITGWSGRGPKLTPEDVASVRIPVSVPSIFAAVEKAGAPHFGPMDRGSWPRALADLLGADPPDCAIFPIQVLGGVAAFLYADRLGRPMDYQDFASIARAAASTANVLARFLLQPNTVSAR